MAVQSKNDEPRLGFAPVITFTDYLPVARRPTNPQNAPRPSTTGRRRLSGIVAREAAIELSVLHRLENVLGGPLRGMCPRVRRALGFETLENRFLKSATLAFTFSGDAVGQGPLGDQSWTAGEIVEFGQAESGLEPGTTSGSFSPIFDLNEFGIEGATIDAFHLVSEDITIAGIRLAKGSLLFSTDSPATFADFTATPSDVVLFTPNGTAPYHSGTFSLLIDGSDIGINADVNAVSLVTADVQLGGQFLSAGTFLLAGAGVEPVGDSPSVAVTSRDVFVLEATTLGSSTTFGTTSLLVDGSDIGLERAISAVHIVSRTGLVGDRTVDAGSLLVALAGNASSIGSNGIEVTAQDVFELAVAQAGGDTIATASLWFEGSDVGLTADAELDGIALTAEPTPNSPPTTTGIADLTVSQDAPDSVIDLFSAFDDAEDSDADLAYTISNNSDPALFDRLDITETGILTLDYATDVFGTSAITVRATDTAGAFVETVFEVTVDSRPTTTGIADLTVSQDAPDSAIDLSDAFGDAEDSDTDLTYTISNNTDPALFDRITLTETGILTLDYATHVFGTSILTVRATDTAGAFVETVFEVTVNSPPTTTGISNVLVTSETSSTVIDLFGAFDDREDSDSELTYTVVDNTAPSLLSEFQFSEETGLLRLGFAADEYGTTEITLRATDSNGDYVETSFAVTVDVPIEPLTPSDPTGHADAPNPIPIFPDTPSPQLPSWLNVDTVVEPALEGEQVYQPQIDGLHTVLKLSTNLGVQWSLEGAPANHTPQKLQTPSDHEEQIPANEDEQHSSGESPQKDAESTANRAFEPNEVPAQTRQAITNQRDTPVAPAPQTATDAPPVDQPQVPQASDAVLATWNEGEEPDDLTTLWNALDDLASETAKAGQPATGERVVVAGIGGVMCVGYVMWAFPRGCLLLLTGTSIPLWKNWDLLSVLPAGPRNRNRHSKVPPEEETLVSILG